MTRAERIRNHVRIAQVLYDYGYNVQPVDREQQFSCDLHGDGRDSKPSARVYPDSGSFHCFACGMSRDAISLVKEKEGVEFKEACTFLEAKYGLPEWVYRKESNTEQEPEKEHVFEEASRRVNTFLSNMKGDGVNLRKLAKWWEAYDMACYYAREKSPDKGMEILTALARKIL